MAILRTLLATGPATVHPPLPDAALLPPHDLHLTPLQRQGIHAPPTPLPATPPTLHLQHDTYLTFNPNPAHPDFDIVAPGCPTIQVGLAHPDGSTTCSHLAFAYRPCGSYVGHLSLQRLDLLRARYHIVQETLPAMHATHSMGSFTEDLIALLLRYRPLPTPPGGKPPPNQYSCLPPSLSQAFVTSLHSTVELFASPLDVSPSFPSYYSLHPADALFGGTHDAFSRPWVGSCVAHPPFQGKLLARALRWAAHSAASTTAPCLTLIVLPTWSNTPYRRYLDHPGIIIHHLDTLPPLTTGMHRPCHLHPTYPPCPPPQHTPS